MAEVRESLAGRYELLEVLGRGGMGVVYRGRDQVLHRDVAVKVLPRERAEDPALVVRFEREARAAAALNHANVVGVYDVGTDGDTRFIVMEYVAGRTLAELVHSAGRLPVDEAVRIAAQIAGALAAAHRAGIVHRDIKSSNVMLDEHGVARVLDFGIARALSDVAMTQTHMVLGSASYLAPEVIRGERATERSDIYALGCVLYELLTGRPPFTGEVAAAILHQHATVEPESPRRLNPGIPAALDALVLRMLAKDPEHRPGQAGEVQAELVRSLQGPATEETLRAVPAAPAGATTEPTRILPSRWGPSRWWRTEAILLALLVIGLIIAILGITGSGHNRTAAHKSSRGAAVPRTSSTVTASAHTTSTAPPRRTSHHRSQLTVSGAAGALTSLITSDLQSGAIDQHGQDLLSHLHGVLNAYDQGNPAAALNQMTALSQEITQLEQHGDIQASAAPAINMDADRLQTALQRASAAASSTPAGPPTHPGPKKGHQPKPPKPKK